MLLQGKVALITGAASERGIGRATAEIFAQQGAKVIIVDLDLAQSQHAAKALGEGHLGLAANVANEEQAHAAVEQALQHYGKIDILVNNVALHWDSESIDEISTEQLLRTFQNNFFSYFWTTKYALKHLKKAQASSIHHP